jgi:hypothetical protein
MLFPPLVPTRARYDMSTETIFSVKAFCSHSMKSLPTEKDFHAHCASSTYPLSRERRKSLEFSRISSIGSWGFGGCQRFVAFMGIRGMAGPRRAAIRQASAAEAGSPDRLNCFTPVACAIDTRLNGGYRLVSTYGANPAVPSDGTRPMRPRMNWPHCSGRQRPTWWGRGGRAARREGDRAARGR